MARPDAGNRYDEGVTSIGLDEIEATGYDQVGSLQPPNPPLPVPANQPLEEIATLPPLVAEAETAYPLSSRTGEPKRPLLLLLSIAFSWLSVAVAIGAYGWWWWQASSVEGLHASARILAWTKPDPPSALAVIMVVIVTVIAIVLVAAAGIVAFNTWAGNGWIRVGSLICLAVISLSCLLNNWFSAMAIPLVLAVILGWLPPAKRFFMAMADFRTTQAVAVPTSGILYGPQPLIGKRELTDWDRGDGMICPKLPDSPHISR